MILNWNANITNVLTILAIGTLVYTLLTRFEGGIVRLLPTKVHLFIDFVAGLGLATSPWWLFADADPSARTILIALGVFEILVSLMTKTHSHIEDVSQIQDGSTRHHASA